ncbi:hypothetical protein AYL99_09174 [Fonsecaea erecta]|uniref:Prokaryotic-type class I peptide chain release factors domain-containing protein n=1 Tax=Fonsecaea erecta TaxID=1367422 RepID=A0A178ZC55_9EURO|nr:hypothetical protein AYL99_09174 [Fonsecaea erecta]OAP57061.1 hypothetical protein AYL99_09174 [Fonsecaea erecta]
MLVCRPLRRLYRRPAFLSQPTPTSAFSTFAGRPHKSGNSIPPRPTLSDAEIKHTYVKGTGPGGQKINKTNSAAQLTHIPTGIVVKSQATRSRSQNHTIAKRILAEKVELLEKGEQSRAAKVVERKQRKKRSADKKKRRKYRRLAEEKLGVQGDVEAEEDESTELESRRTSVQPETK